MQPILYVLCFIIVAWVTLWFFYFVWFQMIFWYGVPYVETPDYKIKFLLAHFKLKKGSTFLEIGCGDACITQQLQEAYPESHCIWIENSFFPYHRAVARRRKTSWKYEIQRWDFFARDISNIDVFYCYLIPYIMPRVWRKISEECKKGTLLYSSAFAVDGVKAKQQIEIKEGVYIYVYEL